MTVFIYLLSALLVNVPLQCLAQTNAKSVLAPLLKDCYSEPWLVDRNNIPPMTLSVLLDIIRTIEDHPGTLGDMRQISTGIVHLFRQDGIVYAPEAASTQNIVPYSPTGFPAYKNRLLLTKLIPNNQFNLPNHNISPEQKCSLHHMISSSLYLHSRGDEEWTCDRLTSSGASARLTQYQKGQDVEIFDINGNVDILGRQIMGVSRCPIETGVVSTPWGDVSMGPVITGISSGLEEQNVLVTDLVTVKSEFNSNTFIVNNRYASTIAGDIAEAAISQGTSLHSYTVGASGGWNSTSPRTHYFVPRNNDLELTDAEIRGGLDGVILSELASAYVEKFPELKLSQLLDMYYSNNGVLHETRFRACNRKVLVPDVASRQTLIDQSLGPAIALYHVSSLASTVSLAGIQNFINQTVDAFHSYIPQNINDPVCKSTKDEVVRPKMNLILITDPSVARRPHISYVVDEIEVGKYGSSVTMMHSATGEVLIEKTFSPSYFYQELAKINLVQSSQISLVKVLEAVQLLAIRNLDTDYADHYCGGNSTVALILTDAIPLSADERSKAISQARNLQRWVPDLRLVFATNSANDDNVAQMVADPGDIIPVRLSAPDAIKGLSAVTEYLRVVPRRIVNPLCGNQWLDENSGTVGFDEFVDANGINLYRIVPNYFYDHNPARLVRIQSTDLGAVSVCYSRSNPFPRRNRTTGSPPGDVVCQSAANSGEVEISLLGACDGTSSIRECPPVYITVTSTAIPIEPQCKENGCRYPNDVKYTVIAHELGCFSGASISYIYILLPWISILLALTTSDKLLDHVYLSE